MKKLINTLTTISIIAVVAVVIATIIMKGKNPFLTFVYEWAMGILLALSIPLLFGWFSLAINKNKIKPQIWIALYSVTVCAYLAIIFSLGFVGRTMDLPAAIRGDFLQAKGLAHVVKSSNSVQTIEVEGIRFNLAKDTFSLLNNNEEYIILYLPKSKFVVNVLCEDGEALLKR